MMLGTTSSSILLAAAGTGGGAPAAAAEVHDSGGGGSGGDGGTGTIHSGFSDEEKGGERGSGGNRWPRQETLALLKIRSEMGVAFRDSSLKGPLWEEVSRKMGELGYQRSAKKCKEKFENVYKYHKRTREGRASKSDGKSYRFFEQLEALENNPSLHHHHHHQQLPPPPPPPPQQPQAAAAVPMPPMLAAITNPPISHVVSTTVSSPNPVSFSPASLNNPIISSFQQQLPPPAATTTNAFNSNNNNIPAMGSHHPINMSDSTSSSSTSSDEDIGRSRKRRKRKFKDFFGRLMKDVIDKQEELQRIFLETLEKRERDRMIREEAWRVQERARMNRELDLLAQERSMSSAKDSAIMQFLQNITAQTTLPSILTTTTTTTTNVPPISDPIVAAQPISVVAAPPPTTEVVLAPPVEASRSHDNGGGGGDIFAGSASSSRWPKAEIEALISLRTNLDMKYQENGPKGPLWEEISNGMSKLGYSRSSKRCKEKWENINKYFKKVKESNKKRPEDSKTCPYFQQLDALYKEKNNKGDHVPSYSSSYTTNVISKPAENNPNMVVPIMVTPEQQWPQQQDHGRMEEDHESDNMDDDDDDGDDDEDEGGEYEIVTNKGPSNSVATIAAE